MPTEAIDRCASPDMVAENDGLKQILLGATR